MSLNTKKEKETKTEKKQSVCSLSLERNVCLHTWCGRAPGKRGY